jgi:hypothetical protein
MTLESIISAVEERYQVSRQEARAVATDIFYSGEPVDDVLASKSVVDKLVSGYRTRLDAASKSVAANDPTTCPVCKLPLKPVLLVNDRKAVFCQKHFVVYPVPPSKEVK